MFHFCRHKSCSFIESDFKVLQAEPSRQWMPPMSMSNQYAHSFEQGRWGDSLANNLTHKEV